MKQEMLVSSDEGCTKYDFKSINEWGSKGRRTPRGTSECQMGGTNFEESCK